MNKVLGHLRVGDCEALYGGPDTVLLRRPVATSVGGHLDYLTAEVPRADFEVILARIIEEMH